MIAEPVFWDFADGGKPILQRGRILKARISPTARFDHAHELLHLSSLSNRIVQRYSAEFEFVPSFHLTKPPEFGLHNCRTGNEATKIRTVEWEETCIISCPIKCPDRVAIFNDITGMG